MKIMFGFDCCGGVCDRAVRAAHETRTKTSIAVLTIHAAGTDSLTMPGNLVQIWRQRHPKRAACFPLLLGSFRAIWLKTMVPDEDPKPISGKAGQAGETRPPRRGRRGGRSNRGRG